MLNDNGKGGQSGAEKRNSSFWGETDSTFNWCESDWMLSDLVAEPVNTVTGFLYVVLAAAGVIFHRDFLASLSKDMYLALFFLALIGVGTVCFHA